MLTAVIYNQFRGYFLVSGCVVCSVRLNVHRMLSVATQHLTSRHGVGTLGCWRVQVRTFDLLNIRQETDNCLWNLLPTQTQVCRKTASPTILFFLPKPRESLAPIQIQGCRKSASPVIISVACEKNLPDCRKSISPVILYSCKICNIIYKLTGSDLLKLSSLCTNDENCTLQ